MFVLNGSPFRRHLLPSGQNRLKEVGFMAFFSMGKSNPLDWVRLLKIWYIRKGERK